MTQHLSLFTEFSCHPRRCSASNTISPERGLRLRHCVAKNCFPRTHVWDCTVSKNLLPKASSLRSLSKSLMACSSAKELSRSRFRLGRPRGRATSAVLDPRTCLSSASPPADTSKRQSSRKSPALAPLIANSAASSCLESKCVS